MANDRFEQQIRFILEIDKLKSILRRTYLIDSRRNENSAEHSWHLAIMAVLLAEHANEPVDVSRVVKMLLVHDIVEIDAGDTYFYDTSAAGDKDARERNAADRLFGLLPPDQGGELRILWEEFEMRKTPEAQFAAALDRFIPQLHNFYTHGKSWQENGITARQVLERNASMAAGSRKLYEWTKALLKEAVSRGYLSEHE